MLKITNFKTIFLMIFFYQNVNSLEKNNDILIRCIGQNFQCKAYFYNKIFDVNIGTNGLTSSENKKEGDLQTPIGYFALENIVFYKKERIKSKFKAIKIKKYYKWCDDSQSGIYNHFFILNKKTKKLCNSYEDLLRDDNIYDYIIPIKYNANPVIAGRGSAIFIHIKKDSPTAGCVAFQKNDLEFIIRNLDTRSKIQIEVQRDS